MNILPPKIRQWARSKKCETLLEALVAISILLIIIGPASALYVASIRTVAVNRNDLVAASLAKEGLEVIRNIRDTNLIRFSSKKATCWNTKPDPGITLNECDKQLANKIGDNDRNTTAKLIQLMFNPDTLQWTAATGADPAPEVVQDLEKYHLRSDVETDQDPECPKQQSCHTHTNLYFLPSPEVDEKCPCPRGKLSAFYRLITVSYSDPGGDNTYPVMKVVSRVRYSAAGGMREVQIVLMLTNEQA